MNQEELDIRFTYHSPKGDQPQRYSRLRSAALEYAALVVELCPDSRESSLAVTHIEESVFWANASIARREVDGIRSDDH